MKECSKCGVEKENKEFAKNSSASDGLYPYCKPCSSQYRKEWRESGNKEKYNPKTWGDPEWVKAYNREYARNMSPEKKKKKWLRKKELELSKLKENNPAAYERRINWGVKTRLKKERVDRYWESREDRDCVSTAKTANKRAAKRGLLGRIKPVEVYRLVADQNGLCANCRCDITKSFHLDHRTALSKGGQNDISNLQILCGPCNTRKGNK